MKKQVQSNVFIGVDVSKDSLDVAVGPSGESMRFANSEDGIARLAAFINPLTPTLVLFEATGGWEMNAVRHLAAKRLPLVVINHRQVRDFAKATGLTLDLTARGMGLRSNRYSMLVVDGVVKSLNVEGPGKFEVSDADTMLGQAKALLA